jgi:hypothetical protein
MLSAIQLVGTGSFAGVFWGELADGRRVAVKVLGARIKPFALSGVAHEEGAAADAAGAADESRTSNNGEDDARNVLVYDGGYRRRRSSPQGEEELTQFKKELEMVSLFRNDRVVSLLGYSMDGPWRCLVFELMAGGGTAGGSEAASRSGRPRAEGKLDRAAQQGQGDGWGRADTTA